MSARAKQLLHAASDGWPHEDLKRRQWSHCSTWPTVNSHNGIKPNNLQPHSSSGSCYSGHVSKNRDREEEKGRRHKDSCLASTSWFQRSLTGLTVNDSTAVFQSSMVSQLRVKVGTQSQAGQGKRADTRVLCFMCQDLTFVCRPHWSVTVASVQSGSCSLLFVEQS